MAQSSVEVTVSSPPRMKRNPTSSICSWLIRSPSTIPIANWEITSSPGDSLALGDLRVEELVDQPAGLVALGGDAGLVDGQLGVAHLRPDDVVLPPEERVEPVEREAAQLEEHGAGQGHGELGVHVAAAASR